jgi:hypothetical protein
MARVREMTTSTPTSTGNAVFRRSDQLVCRPVGGESILVPIRHNVGDLDFVYTLSPVAARVWAQLDGLKSIDEIVSSIVDEFDVARETAFQDVTELLADLQSVALVSQVQG